jgi:hypothetical protein
VRVHFFVNSAALRQQFAAKKRLIVGQREFALNFK